MHPNALYLYHRMEEAQRIHERPEGIVGALCQRLLTDLAVALPHVELQTIRRLCHNLWQNNEREEV